MVIRTDSSINCVMCILKVNCNTVRLLIIPPILTPCCKIDEPKFKFGLVRIKFIQAWVHFISTPNACNMMNEIPNN